MWKHAAKCFSRAAYHTRVFDMVCVGKSECDCMPFPSRIGINNVSPMIADERQREQL